MSFAKGGLRLCFGGIWYRPEDFANVWYRRPERLKAEWQDHVPEGKFTLDEWSEALEGFLAHIPKPQWMNHPSSKCAGVTQTPPIDYGHAGSGLAVPDTLVTQDPGRVREFFTEYGSARLLPNQWREAMWNRPRRPNRYAHLHQSHSAVRPGVP